MVLTDALEDERRLSELGYYQQLERKWSFWNNFGISFAIISIITQLISSSKILVAHEIDVGIRIERPATAAGRIQWRNPKILGPYSSIAGAYSKV